MELKEIIKRNYEATVRRGLIHNNTNEHAFHKAIQCEVNELYETLGGKINPFDPKELADIILVSFSMAHHFGYDIEKELVDKMLFNEKRPN